MEGTAFSKYHPKISVKGAKPHPVDLVEFIAMASVDPPDIDYVPNLPEEVITSGALSDAQLEVTPYTGSAAGTERS